MSVFEDLVEVTETLENRYVKEWKNQGKKAVGYVCSYVPEELFYAADILPYRLTGKGVDDTSQADAYLTRVNCTFCRCLIELGFRGEYDFLEGAVFINGCDHIRRAYENWEAHGSALPFMYILPVPHRISSRGLKYPLKKLKLENWWRGSLNECLSDHFSLDFDEGKLLVYLDMIN